MPASAILWLSMVGASAALLVVHAWLVLVVLRDATLSRGWRLAALVPVLLPIAAARGRHWPGVVAWVVLFLFYLGLKCRSLVP